MTISLTHTITAESVTVSMVIGYASDVDVPTVVHAVIGRGTPDFTLKPAGPRTGTYEMLCTNETAAINLRRLLKVPGALTLADTATSIADTTFMVTGPVGLALDPVTLRRCIVTAPYTETSA